MLHIASSLHRSLLWKKHALLSRKRLGPLACVIATVTACSGDPNDPNWSTGSGGGASTGAGGDATLGSGGNVSSGGASGPGAGGQDQSSGTTEDTSGGAASGGAGNAPSTGGSGAGGGSPGCEGKTGFYVESGKIYDVNCNEFVARGVNDPYAWYKWDTTDYPNFQERAADIASVGANAVRVVLSSGDHPEGWERVSGSEVTNIIDWCKQNKLIAILEVHDSTGSGEKQGVPGPQVAVDYWKSNDIKSAIVGQEAFVWINIANEAFGNSQPANKSGDANTWKSFYAGAVAELREAGINHTFVVDAPNWGQDHQWIMRDGTEPTDIFNADPDKNTVFAVHMYDVYGQASTVSTYFTNFLQKGLPLMVGEFAADHGTGKNVDETTIMAQAEALGVGYLGWSWDGNSADLSSLDIVTNWNPATLSAWGTTLVNDPNGLKPTAIPCTCFD